MFVNKSKQHPGIGCVYAATNESHNAMGKYKPFPMPMIAFEFCEYKLYFVHICCSRWTVEQSVSRTVYIWCVSNILHWCVVYCIDSLPLYLYNIPTTTDIIGTHRRRVILVIFQNKTEQL